MNMITIDRSVVQQALAFTMRDFASLRDFEAAKAVLHDNLRAALAQQEEPVEPVREPVAWIHTDLDKPRVKFLEWSEDEPGYRGRWIKTPLYAAPPRCPNCASLEAQNTELDRRLAELEQAYENGACGCKSVDAAMRLPRAMAQAYENGYKAGAAAERKRIIQFLTEMQRQVGDGHNYYGVAAMRIREMV